MTEASSLVPRTGARVLLLDPLDRVLLIHERIEGGTHWLTPGGGVEPGEDLAAAAVRELYEEIGLRLELDSVSGPPVHQQRRTWHWQGTGYDQTDHFFVLRVAERPVIAPAALTAMEQQTLLTTRWWSADELRATTDVVEPPDLADVLDRLVATDGPPAPRLVP
jgi:8-oxo-dGTP pyrophosphatase MutT (NUDIX family)